MRRFSPGKEEEEEVVEELENDTISMSFRRSIDHKTMAILEKSKALLQETKRQGNISIDPNKKKWQLALKDSSVSEETSTHDQQQDKEPSPPSKSQSQHQQAKEKEAPNSIQKEKMKKKKESKDHSYVPAPNATLVHEAPQSPVPTQSSPKKILEQVHQEMEQVELLQAPEHPPENENEWENELARQILTIYATSVKAKVALQAQAQTQIQEPGTTNGGGPTTMLPSLRLTPAKSSTSRSSSSSNSRFAGSTTLPSTNLPPGSHASVHYSWEPSHLRDDGKVIINLPKIPKPVWFAGTGAVKAVWCALAQGFQDLHESEETETIQTRTRSTTVGAAAAGAICEHHFCEQVRQMEAELKYNKCITTLETLLLALVRARGLEVGELEKKLWKQLVVTCNAFASRAIDYKKFPLALELLKQAERLIQNSILVAENSQMRMELMAFVYDTYAHYYYRRHKPNAAFQYLKKAQDIHTRQSSWSHIAKCRLHLANVLNFQGKHFQSLEMLASILQLIEDNRLEESIGNTNTKIVASAQKICLASVCYNNLAIEQLHLKAFENAHTSCGNAKRLAKLCLSYSNRWLHQFEATGNCVALAITTLMEDANKVTTTTTTTTTKWSSSDFDEKARIAAVTKDVTNNDF
jgi:tetratricopeptide (TPR) repeat protein